MLDAVACMGERRGGESVRTSRSSGDVSEPSSLLLEDINLIQMKEKMSKRDASGN